MTDNEIISIDEAIRHCYETYFERDDLCRECREEHKQLAKWLEELKEIRNTINRQKAEIERLKRDIAIHEHVHEESNAAYQVLVKQAKSEALMHAFSKFAGHSDYHGDTILCQLTCMAEGKETKSAIPIDMNQIKSKAIKKFAERLKEKLQWDVEFDNKLVFESDIDSLVKEMTEER